jgi:hypothetical protein
VGSDLERGRRLPRRQAGHRRATRAEFRPATVAPTKAAMGTALRPEVEPVSDTTSEMKVERDEAHQRWPSYAPLGRSLATNANELASECSFNISPDSPSGSPPTAELWLSSASAVRCRRRAGRVGEVRQARRRGNTAWNWLDTMTLTQQGSRNAEFRG